MDNLRNQILGTRGVADIHIYDLEGNKVAILDSLADVKFHTGSDLQIVAKDALLNIGLLKFIAGHQTVGKGSWDDEKNSFVEELMSDTGFKSDSYDEYTLTPNTGKRVNIAIQTSFRDPNGVDHPFIIYMEDIYMYFNHDFHFTNLTDHVYNTYTFTLGAGYSATSSPYKIFIGYVDEVIVK